MKKLILSVFLLLTAFSCQKSASDDGPPPIEPPTGNIDTFPLRGKILYDWDYSHVYGLEYKYLPFGATGRLPKTVNYSSRWSNQGDKIAAFEWWRVLILDANTMDTLYYNENLYGIEDIDWSPDDQEIALISYQSRKIRILNIKTHASHYINIPGNLLPIDLDWHAQGNSFAVTAQSADNKWGLYILSGNGDSIYTVLSGYDSSNKLKNPRVSPDGKTIAFGSMDASLDFSIYLVDVNTRQQQEFWKNAITPCWSGDGNVIMSTVIKKGAGKYGEDLIGIVAKEVNGTRLRGVPINHISNSLLDWWDR